MEKNQIFIKIRKHFIGNIAVNIKDNALENNKYSFI